MEEALSNSNSKEFEAVKELISKIPPEDLERAAGGISEHAKNILLATGALAIVATTGCLVWNLGNRVSTPVSSATVAGSFERENVGTYSSPGVVDQSGNDYILKSNNKMSDIEARKQIETLGISKTLVKVVCGEEEKELWKVFSKWVYFEVNSDGTEKLRPGFRQVNDDDGVTRIYHEKSQFRYGWLGLGKAQYKKGEKYAGVPYSNLVDYR